MKPGVKNALVIGVMLLVSLGLILATRFLLPGAERSQDDIQQQIANLSESSPTPAPSAASEVTKAADEGQKNKGTECFFRPFFHGLVVYVIARQGDAGRDYVFRLKDDGFHLQRGINFFRHIHPP